MKKLADSVKPQIGEIYMMLFAGNDSEQHGWRPSVEDHADPSSSGEKGSKEAVSLVTKHNGILLIFRDFKSFTQTTL